jgi:tRNA threonylcarbamoyladenosine biosynthesis protein TsaE
MLARELGVTDPVRSPSFTLANVYAGPVTVNHLDLYRLEALSPEDTLALEEYMNPAAITIVEWPETGLGRLGEPSYMVQMDHDTADTRQIAVLAGNEDARSRWEAAGS